MKNKHATQALQCIGDKSPLSKLLHQLKKLEEVNRRVLALLDPHLRHYCRVVNLIGGRMVIVTANSSIATHIKLRSAALLAQFQKDDLLKTFQYIHSKVERPPPSQTQENKPLKHIDPLSEDASNALLETAQSIDHPGLQHAIMRIAKHTKK